MKVSPGDTFVFGNSCLTNMESYARILWQSSEYTLIRSDTQEAEGVQIPLTPPKETTAFGRKLSFLLFFSLYATLSSRMKKLIYSNLLLPDAYVIIINIQFMEVFLCLNYWTN